MSGRLVVEIERLVVDGVESSERTLLAFELERELERLVADRGIPDGLVGEETPVLEAQLDLGPHDGAATIGARAARALYGALGR
jgi:hypothetical protein